MANKSNLVPQAHKLTVEEQSKGGKKSVEVRRTKKMLREYIEDRLAREAIVEGEKSNRKDWIAAKLVSIIADEKTTVKDFLKALEILRDTIGEMPTQNVQMEVIQETDALDELLDAIKSANNDRLT